MTTQEQLARIFRLEMQRTLSDDELRIADARNAQEPEGSGTCHSHDFTDSNLVMFEAFKRTMDRDPDYNSDDDLALWTSAWNIAAERGFSGRVVQRSTGSVSTYTFLLRGMSERMEELLISLESAESLTDGNDEVNNQIQLALVHLGTARDHVDEAGAENERNEDAMLPDGCVR